MSAPMQLYVTHCNRTDSVTNTVGFSVRATSNPDANALKSLDYPAYELPLDLWAKMPSRAEAPRRLARVRAPGGVLLVHSSFIEKDTMGRDRSYFTHAMLLKQADPADVLRSWGSQNWITDYATGASKTIPAPAGVPTSQRLTDITLSAFLGTGALPTGQPLSLSTCPDRLATDAPQRMQLAEQFLHGLLLAKKGGRNRHRFFVHAEPGLLAMLLYAAVRVLPKAFVADLTFSTYEPAQRGIKDFDSATVIGTYFGHPSKTFDAELGTTRGFVLDTVQRSRSSQEVQAAAHPVLKKLLELAAAGKWRTLENVAQLLGKEDSTLDELHDAVRIAKALDRIHADPPTPRAVDLQRLNKNKHGVAALNKRRAQVWPLILQFTLSDSAFGDSFRNWFTEPGRCLALLEEAFVHLQAGRASAWQNGWHAAKADEKVAGEQLRQLVAKNHSDIDRLNRDVRSQLRNALISSGVELSNEVAVLFQAREAHELQELLTDLEIPAKGRGIVAWLAFARRAESAETHHMAEHTLRWLLGAPVEVLGEFCRRAIRFAGKAPQIADETITPLISPHSANTLTNWDRLLNTVNSILPPEYWAWLCEHFALLPLDADLPPMMFENYRLARLLRCFAAHEFGLQRWAKFTESIDIRCVLNANSDEARLRNELETARTLLFQDQVDTARVLPPETTLALNAARTLANVLDGGTPSANEMQSSLKLLAGNVDHALQMIYQSRFAASDPANDDNFARFAHVFNVCYPLGDTYPTVEPKVRKWLDLSALCMPQWRSSFQWYYLEQYIPNALWPALVQNPALRLEADVIHQMREGSLVIGEKEQSPVATKEFAQLNEAGAEASDEIDTEAEEEVISRPKRKRKKTKSKDGTVLVWVAAIVLLVFVIGGVVAYAVITKKF